MTKHLRKAIKMKGLFELTMFRVSVHNPLALLPEPEASQHTRAHSVLEKAAHLSGSKDRQEGAIVPVSPPTSGLP